MRFDLRGRQGEVGPGALEPHAGCGGERHWTAGAAPGPDLPGVADHAGRGDQRRACCRSTRRDAPAPSSTRPPDLPRPVVRAAITLEPAGGSPAPTGPGRAGASAGRALRQRRDVPRPIRSSPNRHGSIFRRHLQHHTSTAADLTWYLDQSVPRFAGSAEVRLAVEELVDRLGIFLGFSTARARRATAATLSGRPPPASTSSCGRWTPAAPWPASAPARTRAIGCWPRCRRQRRTVDLPLCRVRRGQRAAAQRGRRACVARRAMYDSSRSTRWRPDAAGRAGRNRARADEQVVRASARQCAGRCGHRAAAAAMALIPAGHTSATLRRKPRRHGDRIQGSVDSSVVVPPVGSTRKIATSFRPGRSALFRNHGRQHREPSFL